MDLKKIISENLPALKKIIFGEENTTFKDVKTADGSIVRYKGDTPMKGMPITVITDSGEVPVPTGEVSLEDGTVIVVEDGVIVDVKQAATEEVSPIASEEMAEPTKDITPDIKKIVESVVKETVFSMQEKIDSQSLVIESQKTEIESIKEFSKQMLSVIEAIGAEPEAKPAEVERGQSMKEFSKFLKSTKELRKELRRN